MQINGRHVALYWQKNFEVYLSKEYKLGEKLWLYLGIVGWDFKKKEILVFVRDFALLSDEEIVKKRLETIEKLGR